MIKIEDVLDRVNTKDGLAFYGVTFDSRNFAPCPFHSEKTPSFHYNPKTDRYHCFSCGKSGTVIDFVAESFQFTLPKELPKVLGKINDDFNLGLGKPLSVTEKRAYEQEQRLNQGIKAAASNWKRGLSASYDLWAGVYRTLYHTFLNADEGNPGLRELLERLEDALEDFSGNTLRAWPPRDLSEEQKQWLQTTVRQIKLETEEVPSFKQFCETEHEKIHSPDGRAQNHNPILEKRDSLQTELMKAMEG